MMQWEYWSVAVPTRADKKASMFAEAGTAGWELVSVDGAVAYFKRPKVRVAFDDGLGQVPMSSVAVGS